MKHSELKNFTQKQLSSFTQYDNSYQHSKYPQFAD